MRILACCCMLTLVASGSAAPLQIEASFRPDAHVVAGTMRIEVEGPSEDVWFALLANLGRTPNPYVSPLLRDGSYVAGFDPAWTEVERVTRSTPDGEEELSFELLPAPPTMQTFSLDDVLLRVHVPGGAGEVTVAFQTRFPHIWAGEPGRLGDVYTWRFGWHPLPFSPPTDDRWPLFLSAHEYQLSLNVPSGWDAALPGELSSVTECEATVFHVRFAEPVRSIPLLIAPEGVLHRVSLEFPGITVEAVALGGHQDKLRALATYIPEILAYYTELYGPYPEQRLVLVEHPNELGVAMTADGVVYMPRWLFRRLDLTAGGILSRFERYILAHELAHLWWGIGIGVDLDAENWLSEGMAQYLSIRWYEARYGAEGGNVFRFETPGLGEEMADTVLGFFNLRQHLIELPYLRTAFAGFDEAVVKPSVEVRYEQASTTRLYDKGYLVLRAAAHLAGEETFDGVLRQAHARWRSDAFTVDDLRFLLEEATGMDWGGFFSQWVYGEAWADYAVTGLTRATHDSEHVTQVHVMRTGTGAMPVTLEVRGPHGETASEVWDAEESHATIVFHTAFEVRQAVLDPSHQVLDTDRLNNTWPRKFVVTLSRNDLPLDAYLVQLDLSSEGFTISYLDRFGWGIYPEALAVTGWVRHSRQWAVSGWGALRGTLVGALSLTHYLWATPNLGSPGTFWEPVGELALTISRRPAWAIGADLGWRQTLTRTHSGGLSLLWLPGVGWRGQLTHTQLVGLFPHTYLGLSVHAGLASDMLPPSLLPALTEFRTLRDEHRPRDERKFMFSLGVWLPPLRPDYSMGGAALVTEVRPRLYASWARLWKEGEREKIIPPFAEVGVEALVQIEALGGLMGFTTVIGIGWSLSPRGEGIFYIGILGL